MPTESASSFDIEVSSKLFKDRDSGNSSPDMFLARLLSVDSWRCFPPDAQNIFPVLDRFVDERLLFACVGMLL